MNDNSKCGYEKFLLGKEEIPYFPDNLNDGINIIPTGISELEQCENGNQVKLLEAVFHTICNLFQIDDIEMQTTGYCNSFFKVQREQTEFNNQRGMESPRLSRDKLRKGDSKEIADAIIDLITQRDDWSDEKFYRRMELGY